MSRSDSEKIAATEDLLREAAAGDRSALDRLVVRHLPQLRMHLRLHGAAAFAPRESVDDLAHSVCREVLEALDDFEFRGDAAFRKWLFMKAESKLADRHRFHHAARRDVARESVREVDELRASFLSASMVAMNNEDLESLEAAFEKLPDDYREVIRRAKLIGESHAEIEAAMGRPPGATRELLRRAMTRLAFLARQSRID